MCNYWMSYWRKLALQSPFAPRRWKMYDVIVIGAGPAGLAAATYTLRQQLRTLIIAPDLAGKAAYRLFLPWMKERETIIGEETVELLRQRVIGDGRATRYLDQVERVFVHDDRFHVMTIEGGAFITRALIVATGLRPLSLGVPGEQRLMGYGVSYSVTSHAPLFARRRVVVIGHDLRALRSVAALRAVAEHVTLVTKGETDIASALLGRELLSDDRVTILENYQVREITGDNAVSGVIVSAPDETTQHIMADGVFIELGLDAPNEFLDALVERTTEGRIVVDSRCATRTAGLFAAGDVTSSAYAEQILIAIGEGSKAGLSACAYLHESAVGMPTSGKVRAM
jgi:thioredoxin reductase